MPNLLDLAKPKVKKAPKQTPKKRSGGVVKSVPKSVVVEEKDLIAEVLPKTDTEFMNDKTFTDTKTPQSTLPRPVKEAIIFLAQKVETQYQRNGKNIMTKKIKEKYEIVMNYVLEGK